MLHEKTRRLAAAANFAVLATLLPDGAVFFDGQYDYAIRGGGALRWCFGRYDRAIPFANCGPQEMCIVTPAKDSTPSMSGRFGMVSAPLALTRNMPKIE